MKRNPWCPGSYRKSCTQVWGVRDDSWCKNYNHETVIKMRILLIASDWEHKHKLLWNCIDLRVWGKWELLTKCGFYTMMSKVPSYQQSRLHHKISQLGGQITIHWAILGQQAWCGSVLHIVFFNQLIGNSCILQRTVVGSFVRWSKSFPPPGNPLPLNVGWTCF